VASIRTELDAVIVGAGFAGLYMLHRLRGLGLSTRLSGAENGIGGTWYWNRYRSTRCDVESIDYFLFVSGGVPTGMALEPVLFVVTKDPAVHCESRISRHRSH
jgi:cation diffusion facilitator CzcD-associated flavoprotein CzcO